MSCKHNAGSQRRHHRGTVAFFVLTREKLTELKIKKCYCLGYTQLIRTIHLIQPELHG